MENETQARARWRLVEQLGRGVGWAAGGTALGLLWIYSLAMDARRILMAGRAKGPPS